MNLARNTRIALTLLLALGAAPGPAAEREPSALAELSLARSGDSHVAVVRNLSGGPVEIQLEAGSTRNIRSVPDLPLRLVLAAGEQRPIATLSQRSHNAGQFDLRLANVPGLPGARHQDVPYRLPLPADAGWRLVQGFHGPFSHTDAQNRYAIDLAVPEGTPVLAARGGTVMNVETGYTEGGLDPERHLGRANHVRILHPDGSMAVYAHLQPVTVVLPGEPVEAGSLIGYSGNTGFSAGPHLHIAVQVNTGLRLESVPFRLVDARGRPLAGAPDASGEAQAPQRSGRRRRGAP